MRTVNLHEAKTHLSRLVDQAASGEPCIIAKAGRPLVRVVPLGAPGPRDMSRIGFMTGQIQVPDGFDLMGEGAIEDQFEGR